MTIRQSVIYLLIVCFLSVGSVTNGQVNIARLLNGALQTIIGASENAVTTERANSANYVKHLVEHYQKAGVEGDILGTNYQASVDLYQSLAVNQQQYQIIGALIKSTLAEISVDVKKQTCEMGLDVDQWLSDLFQDLADDGANIMHTNNQELYHIVNEGGAYALSLNRQSHQSGANVNLLQGLLNDVLAQVSDQFTEAVAQRHQQFMAVFESKGRNAIHRIIRIIEAFYS